MATEVMLQINQKIWKMVSDCKSALPEVVNSSLMCTSTKPTSAEDSPDGQSDQVDHPLVLCDPAEVVEEPSEAGVLHHRPHHPQGD